MNDQFLEEELNKIKALAEKLKPHWQKEVRNIPEHLQAEIKTIESISPITASGLETTGNVMGNLYFAQAEIEDRIKQKNIFPSTPKPSATPMSSTPVKPSASSPQKVEDKYRKEKPLDFGPFSK